MLLPAVRLFLKMKLFKGSFLPAFTWLLIVTILMLLPGSEFPEENWFQEVWLDKWVHLVLFFVLVYLFQLPLSSKQRIDISAWRLGIALTAATYGTGIEFIQKHWVAGRSFDVGDIIFDCLGCIAAYFVGSQAVKK
ncbi:MAG: hypothetical protein K0Q66_356 [Chitinophagaceae bacterium]|nr:hypothetical protein [Chitinophagaceae bacterium]